MNDAILLFVFCLLSTCLLEVSSGLFDFRPAKYARDRYERSRNTTIVKSVKTGTSFGPTLDFIGLVNHFDYLGEEHPIQTVDGYKLKIHRIPGSPSNPKKHGKPVVFFQHGFLGSSDSWVLVGPEKDLAYMLVDAGFDVWLGNARGNTYSRAHATLNPDHDPEFWEFSFHEIAVYDLPASIDYILGETGQSSILYVGHSMGTTISYVLLSSKPEYNDRIWLVISLAPVAFWRAPPGPFVKFLKKNAAVIQNIIISAKIHELLPLTAGNIQLARSVCNEKSAFLQLCSDSIYLLFGKNPRQLDVPSIPYLLSYFPAGGSAQTLMHFSQHALTGEFRMFDYGTIRNFAVYKQKLPSDYNLSNVTAPVALFYGEGDALVAPKDPVLLYKKLPNVVHLESVKDKNFSHLDFLFARDIKPLLNDRIMDVIMFTLRRANIS